MDIKEEVYKLLWELFENECPLFAKLQANNGNDVYDDDFIVWINEKSERDQIWTILNEILPNRIYIKNRISACKLTIVPCDNYINYFELTPLNQFGDFQIQRLFEIESNRGDIWQPILSLLKAIESHGERDNLKFVWGEK